MSKKSLSTLVMLALIATLSLYGCDTGGGGHGGGGGKAGVKKILANGGTGSGYLGGNGTDINIMTPGDITVSQSGIVNAAFTTPAGIPPYVGCVNEFKPMASLTVGAFSNSDSLDAVGDYYLLIGSSQLMVDSNNDGIANTSAFDTQIDCMDIPSGVTVTFEYNGEGDAYMGLDEGVRIKGTVKTGLQDIAPADSAGLWIWANNFHITSTGKVLTKGSDSATGSAYNGGDVTLTGWDFIRNDGLIDTSGGKATGSGLDAGDGGHGGSVELNTSDSLAIHTGTIRTNGGNGADGGDSGYVSIWSYDNVFSTGKIEAGGGTGTDGSGGYANGVQIYTYSGFIGVAGNISANGGNGTQSGGSSDGLSIGGEYDGAELWIHEATLNFKGGNATDTGSGGSGGGLEVYKPNNILMSGSFNASGGNGKGTGEISGGDGGYVGIYAWQGYSEADLLMPQPNIEVSMNFDLSGGDGVWAGNGGGEGSAIYIENDPDDYWFDWSAPGAPSGQVKLLGYAEINLSGGSCTDNCSGGSAGGIELDTLARPQGTDAVTGVSVGGMFNDVPIVAKGGNGNGDGSGGEGGGMFFYNDLDPIGDYFGPDLPPGILAGLSGGENQATLNFNGGNAGSLGEEGGSGGGFGFQVLLGMNNSGMIKCAGGSAASGYGGNGGGTGGETFGDVTYTASVLATGGNGGIEGGSGGGAEIYSLSQVKNGGNITASGANGDTGGDGGDIYLYSSNIATANTGTLDVTGGDGQTDVADGDIGYIEIDGVNVTPANGVL